MTQFIGWLTCMCLSSISLAQGSLVVEVNGQTIAVDELRHQVFCLDNPDQFVLKYQSRQTQAAQAGDYVITGIDLWAQILLGRPRLIGQLASDPNADPGGLSFSLASFDWNEVELQESKAIRVSVRIHKVIRVEKRKVLETVMIPRRDKEISFMIVKGCQ